MVPRLLAILLAAWLLAACSTGGSGSSTVPDSGVIWFGSSIDAGSLVLTGRASSFPRGTPVAYLAHLNRLSTGETLGLAILGGGSITGNSLGQIAAGQGLIGQPIDAIDITSPGTYSVSIVDASGTHLADGSFTVNP